MTVERIEPPLIGSDRDLLLTYLDYHRATFEMKCEGLDAEQLARRATPPSTLSLLGLLRHLAEVERSWFRRVEGLGHEPIYYTKDEPDLDFDGAVADDAVVEQAWTDWRREVAIAKEITGRTDLEQTFVTRKPEPRTFRWLLLHLIEEYARHNGHADLLREAVDGQTGE